MTKVPQITYTFTPITDVFISRALYTLYKYSEPGTFRVVVMDQTKDGFRKEVMDYIKPMVHLYLHPFQRQLGYAKAQNECVLHALHWGTPYICMANDDIEIMDKRWLQGIWDTFDIDEKIMGVVPMNPRVPGWGYGVDYNPELLPYKEEYTKEDYDYLIEGDFSKHKGKLPDTFPRNVKDNVIDGAIFIMPYFKREFFEKVGLLDEHFYPGSGEDMDAMARAYREGYRIVSTAKSWIWHHLSKSKDLFASGELEDPYYKPADKPYWNNMGELWPEGFDAWGKDKEGKPYPRVKEVFVDQI